MRRILGLIASLFLLAPTVSGQAPTRAYLAAETYMAARTGWGNACTVAQHSAYSAIGPDGKRYPVWHPPVDPSGCFYFHEHGANPATSPLDSLGPVLFGYVNEQAFLGPSTHRHEDHPGHKVFVANNAVFAPTAQALINAPLPPLTCHVLTKFHQGTHSQDAFTNNLHEQVVRLRCDNGWGFDVQMLSANGKAGTMRQQCGTQVLIAAGPAVPGDSPTAPPLHRTSMGDRFIPTDVCAERSRPDLFEVWKTQNLIRGPSGGIIVQWAFYYSVSDPSRYFSASGLRRSVDQCYRVVGGVFQTTSNPCLALRNNGTGVPVTWDSEESPFKGTQRGVRLTGFNTNNANGPVVFYTDVLGINTSLVPFPGSVRQHVLHGNYPYPLGGTTNSVGGNYNAPGVRAPN